MHTCILDLPITTTHKKSEQLLTPCQNKQTFVLACELIDNLPHDKIYRCPKTQMIQQALVVHNDDNNNTNNNNNNRHNNNHRSNRLLNPPQTPIHC
mmetsp:Transcript_2454/g.3545  ORF Transcript_2454/g.3545 Transcript_2454/m.3545 type:complete len:96 (-) Transcript_2454:1169-1456(-)